MKRSCLLWLIIIPLVSACNWGVPKNNAKPAVTRDTLAYTYKVIRQRADDCGNKPDTACTGISIIYPVFAGNKTLNDAVIRDLTNNLRFAEYKDNNLQQLVRHYFSAYKEDKATNPGVIYEMKGSDSVLRQDSSIVTLQLSGYSYLGGAHGGSITKFLNWNTRTNKKIGLNDILSGDYSASLTAVGERIFRKQEKLSDTASLKNDYFFKDGKFALNDNFLVTPIGLRFLYNEYEIKSYAAGQTSILIPYAQIRSLLRPNTVISQYIK
ncbi:MAG: DUF3298 and DUF4163 domain-containing protein [Bacteroidetes bacterium]|nr:DUF3298 and DUF4163 domain-containing protein [Bacteroidota bacterium]